MDVLSEPGTGPSPALPSGTPTVDPGATADGFPTRQLCPYLAIEGGGWRSAHASKDHRCAALTPPAILAIEKQRRLCLGAAHRSCATYQTAEALESGETEPAAAAAAAGASPASQASDATVTRWALVRTVPVVLDHARVPVNLGSLARDRTAPQLMLGGLLVLAFLAVALGRLPGQGGPSTAGLLSSASPSPSAPASPTPRPTPRPSPSPSPSVAPSLTPIPSASPKPYSRTYTVRAGDFLLSIANRFGTTVKAIVDLNNIKDPSALQVGQVLKIP